MLETEYSQLREGGKGRGTGPSLASREIKKAQEEISLAHEMGQELLREDIQISSSSQIEEGRRVDQNASHRADKPKRRSGSRWRSSRSNHFESRLERAQKEKEKITVAEIQKDTNTSMEMVIATANDKHEVIISTRPTCTCQDFIKNEKDLCKHIIWVCLCILEVPVASPNLT